MDFFNMGVPVGTYWDIRVRLHFTFFIFAYWEASAYSNFLIGLVFVFLFFGSILLHEFGHALAARWCDGEATDILLWPLGGLAFVRPAFNPTAHLITTVAGPFVTLVLWLIFSGLTHLLGNLAGVPGPMFDVCSSLSRWNLRLLLFNLIPAFPMDGGRILRDALWHFLRAETATVVSVWISRIIAGIALVWAALNSQYMLIFMALFIFWEASREQQMLAFEASGTYQFSIRERLQRGRRRRAFYGAVKDRQKEDAATAFHRCAVCGKTDHDDPTLDFRVCTDCKGDEEYCPDHLHHHQHT